MALVALVGTWTGHTLEYARVGGRVGLREELFGSVHVYMLPVGALLVVLAATGGLGWWRTWQAVGRRLDAVRGAVAAALRGRRVDVPRVSAAPSQLAGVGALTLLLAGLQLGLYLLQENVEALATGRQAPLLGAVLGVHALAPLVHLGVAAVLAGLMAAAGHLLRRRAERVTRVARLLRVLLASLAATAPPPAPVSAWCPSPLDRLGRQLLRRPPPTALAVR